MSYTEEQIKEIVEKQRAFFLSGATLDVDWRIVQLKRLKVQMSIFKNPEF